MKENNQENIEENKNNYGQGYSKADIEAILNNNSENENSNWWIVIFLILSFSGFNTNIKSDRENLIKKLNENNLNYKEKKEIINILLN